MLPTQFKTLSSEEISKSNSKTKTKQNKSKQNVGKNCMNMIKLVFLLLYHVNIVKSHIRNVDYTKVTFDYIFRQGC